jgi:hypothetical protein
VPLASFAYEGRARRTAQLRTPVNCPQQFIVHGYLNDSHSENTPQKDTLNIVEYPVQSVNS